MALALESNEKRPPTVDDYLNNVNFDSLNSGAYIPTKFSIKFMNFIKLCNESGEDNSTPVMHLAMLDKLATQNKRIANLCARGTAKTTLFMEYLCLYLGVFNVLPGFGEVSGILYVSDSMDNGVKSARQSIEFRYNNSEFLQYWIPKARFTENYIEFENRAGKKTGIKMFGAKSGIRGTKIFGKRPVLAIMDDLVSDLDSKSKTAMEAIKDTVYSGVQYALDPTRQKMVLNGTPFNKEDIVYEAIESGAWQVNVWPVCEEFPCSKEEFKGAWEDRFSYQYVKEQYETAVRENKVKNFRQELMLRITSDEARLIKENEILWTSGAYIRRNKHLYNFYITTDFATSSKQTADYSVISVWAYDKDGNWIWVDGVCARQTMNVSINDLFNFVTIYQPQEVGVEISGQQGAFIQWLNSEMNNREIYFNYAKQKGNPGIRPSTDKLSRLNMVVPYFTNSKVYWADDKKYSTVISIFMEQISLATKDGIKGKDDALDTISMLQYMNPWKPSTPPPIEEDSDDRNTLMWGENALEADKLDNTAYSSYI